LAASAPDVRRERVAEQKEKINDPSYINESVINATANNLIDALFG
jgi:negative regulator of flagellin synthesis FlgM